MYTLLPLFIIIAAVSSTDLQVGTEGGKKIYDAKIEATPAIWKQVQNLTVNATENEVISRIVVTDLRTNKDGEVKIVEGGEGQKNVTLEFKSPTVLRGFEFQVQVFAAPGRKGRETVAETPVASGEPELPVDASVPIVNDTVINEETNEDAMTVTTDVVNGTAEMTDISDVETPVEAPTEKKKRETDTDVTPESEDNENTHQDATAEDSDSKDESQDSESENVQQESDSEDQPQGSQVSDSEDGPQETQGSDSEDGPQDSLVSDSEDESQDSQDSDSEDGPQDSQKPEADEGIVLEPEIHTIEKRDTGDMSQASQVEVYQSQESHDSGESENQDSQETDGEEQESTDEQQRKREAQQMPQIQISGEMPEVQMPEVQLPEIQIPDGLPEVQIGVEMPDKEPQERAAQETPETQIGGEEMPQDQSEPLPQDPIAQYVSEQNVSNENPIQAPLVPEVMLEENNSTHFNDSAVIVKRSPNKYEEKTEPPTEPPTEPTTEETTTEPPTESTTTEEPKKHHYHHHNWHNSQGYY